MAKYEFTEKALAALPAAKPGSNYIDRDAKTDGLAIRVTATGYKSFLFCYRSDELDKAGKRKERRIEMGIPWQQGDGTLTYARQQADKRRVELRDGKDQLSTREQRRLDEERQRQEAEQAEAARIAAEVEASRHSDMSQLAHRYLEEHAKLNKRSWKEDERRLNAYVIPWAGTRKVRDLTRQEISEWLRGVATGNNAEGIPPRRAEANARLALLRKMFSFAEDAGIIPMGTHPCLRMKAPGGDIAPRDRALQTGREFRIFWRLTDREGYLTQEKPEGVKRLRKKWRHPHLPADVADALRLVLLTGCRIEEICGLRWSEVDMTHAQIDLPKARVKNKRDHMVPLIEPAMEILRRRQSAGGKYVFPALDDNGKASHLRRDRVSHTLRPIADTLLPRIEMAAFTAHDLRRTVETGMAAARVPREYRDRVLNHVDKSVGATSYNKWDYIDEKREALEKWWQRFVTLRDAGPMPDNVVPLRKRA